MDLFTIVYWSLIVLVIAWFGAMHVLANSKHGKITVGQHDYLCEMGDNIERISGQPFSGISISLPKKLPQIFINSLANDRIKGPDFLFAPGQKLSLEGNFDQYFQAFAPKKAQSLTLSILTPDIMETLTTYGKQFDIEINENHIYIISASRLFLDKTQEKPLMEIATKLLEEVDYKLASWQESNDNEDLKLEVRDHRAVRVAHHYFSWWGFWHAAFLIIVASPFWYWGLYMITRVSDVNRETGWVVFAAGFFFFPGVYLFVRTFLHHRPRSR